MTRRSFFTGLALTVALLLAASGGATQNSSQINHYKLFSFMQERGQVRLGLANDAASLVKEMRLEIYSFNGGKVFDSGAVGNQPIVWNLRDRSGADAPHGKYICSIQYKLDGGESDVLFWQLTKSAQGVNFTDALRLYLDSPADGAREFFKRLTAARPDDASAWLWHGQSKYNPSEAILWSLITPPYSRTLPPPPPQAPPPQLQQTLPPPPPPPLPEKEKLGGQQRRITIGRSAGLDPDERDLKEAIKAFQKALDLAVGCKTKIRALDYLAITYSRLKAEAEETEAILKKSEGECATKEIKASSYYLLGVKHWQCAYSLSTAYTDRNRNSYDPFHFRNFTNPADKRKFDDCLTKGFEFFEKSLALNPEYVEAIFYQGLLYREKQKAAADDTERRQLGEEAQKLAAKGTDLQRRKEGRQ